jgi:hypothetical protein
MALSSVTKRIITKCKQLVQRIRIAPRDGPRSADCRISFDPGGYLTKKVKQATTYDGELVAKYNNYMTVRFQYFARVVAFFLATFALPVYIKGKCSPIRRTTQNIHVQTFKTPLFQRQSFPT